MTLRKYLFLMIFQFTSIQFTITQSIVVSVSLEGEDSSIGTSIQIFQSGKKSLIDFCVVGENNKCKFILSDSGKYNIYVKYFGFRDTTHAIILNNDENIELHFVLEPISFDLPGISIIDKIMGIKKRGDTLQYNLRAYTNGSEKYLGDVIQSLPGIELDINGNVKVRNKKIDALLIEGKEIINDQHILATEGIQNDVIESIELINNYRTQEELFENVIENEKIALNVILKENAKLKWKGNVKIAGGYKKANSNAINLFKTTDKNGWSLFIRSNNIGRKGIEKPLNIILEDVLNKNSNDQIRLYPYKNTYNNHRLIYDPLGIIKNADYHVALNGDITLSEKFDNKLYFTGTIADRDSKVEYERLYLLDNVSEFSKSQANNGVNSLYFRNKSSAKWDYNHFTQLTIPFQANFNNFRNYESGKFDNLNFLQSNESTLNHFYLKPILEHIFKIDNDITVKLEQIFELEKSTNIIDLSSNDSFFGSSPEPTNEIQRINQNIKTTNTKSNTQIRFEKRWKKDYFKINTSISSEEQEMRSSGFQIPTGNNQVNQSLENKAVQFSIKGLKNYRKLRIVGSVNYSIIQQNLNELDITNHSSLLPTLLFHFEYYKTHAVSISYTSEAQYYGLEQFNRIQKILDARTLSLGSLNSNAIQKSKTFNFSLFKGVSATDIMYNLNFSYSNLSDSYIQTSTIYNDYVEEKFILSPEVNRLIFRAWFSKFFNSWSILSDNIVSYDKGFTSTGDELFVPINRLISNYKIKLRSKNWNNLNFVFGIGSSIINQELYDIKSVFNTYDISTETKFYYNNWVFKIELIQRIQSTEDVNNNVTEFNFETIFDMNDRWDVSLVGNNIFNLQSREFIQARFNPNYNQVLTYQTFPGNIMIRLERYF